MKRTKYAVLMVMGVLMLFILPGKCNMAMAATILPTDVTTAAAGNEMIGLEGSYATDVQAAIDLVNKYRLEACTKGYPDPRNKSRALTKSDYVPVKWSSDLEYIARIRAAEASIYESHTRPNGKSGLSMVSTNGVDSFAEVLAWGGNTISASVKMWYSEKSTWIEQGDGVTGHYTSMISPNTTYMGMANFNGTGAGEFTNNDWVNFGNYGNKIILDETPLPIAENVIQTVEVPKARLSALKPKITTKITDGKTGSVSLDYTYDGSKSNLFRRYYMEL